MHTMAESGPGLKEIHEGFEEWHGAAPDFVSTFRHDQANDGVPTEIDVLFFLPEEGPGEDDITTVTTAGMSSRPLKDSDQRVELVFELKGQLDDKGRETLARQLADLAILPFQKGWTFGANTVLDGIVLHPFERMTHLLIKNWSTTEETLPDVDPEVVLLRVIPLFEKEAAVVREVGDVAALARFLRQKAKMEDFDREPLE
jgi:hypothetical protein